VEVYVVNRGENHKNSSGRIFRWFIFLTKEKAQDNITLNREYSKTWYVEKIILTKKNIGDIVF
jgi:hypothetical protein